MEATSAYLIGEAFHSVEPEARLTVSPPHGMLSIVRTILLAALVAYPVLAAAQAPPSFVFILVDDLGWTDVGYMGSDFYETPNIDALAASGVRFTNAYAATTVCSPTRASVLTGQYPARLRLTDWIHGHARPWARLRIPDWTHLLRQDETTIAEVLARAGYDTISIGKWHLGFDGPEAHGFETNVAGYDKGQPPSYHAPYEIPTLPEGREGEYLTDRLTEEAVAFLEEHRRRQFFLYLPYYTVHTPIQPKAGKLEKYEAKPPGEAHRNAGYASMIESLDDGVGRILSTLERLERDTVVIFTSDNGGLVLDLSDWGPITSNAPLREGKGSSYEGGVRVPLAIRWPGVAEPGRAIDVPVISTDFYPTIAEMARIRSAPMGDVDGESLVPLLRGDDDASLDRDALYWHYPHYHPGGATPYGAIRRGDFKLIEFYEDEHVELYNLRDDPGETTNLAESMAGHAEALRQALGGWRRDVGAQMPTPNPAFDPTRATEFTR